MIDTMPDFLPLVPELILAGGAMLMLMAGVFLGAGTSRMVNAWCVLVLVAAGVGLIAVPAGRHVLFEAASCSTTSRAS